MQLHPHESEGLPVDVIGKVHVDSAGYMATHAYFFIGWTMHNAAFGLPE